MNEPTRELFWSLDGTQILLFYLGAALAGGVFLAGCWRLFDRYRRARRLPSLPDLRAGLGRALVDVLSQRTVRRRDALAGWAHTAVFAGYLIGAIGTAVITVEYDFLAPLFDIRFWRGDFYLWYSLILDLGHLGLTVGLLVLIGRRLLLRPAKLDYRRRYRGERERGPTARRRWLEDWGFLLFLLAVEITGFLLEGARLLMEQPAWAAWSPVGRAVAALLAAAGMDGQAAASFRVFLWWLHGALALGFTAAIPWYKARHMLLAVGSLAVRDRNALRRLPREPEEAGEAGIGGTGDLTWKDLLDLDACTRCGRCHEACPARTVGAPLSPRDLVLDLGEAVRRQGPIDLAGGTIAAETLWSCICCGACQEICPVGIEHPPLIVRMRRRLVERDELDPLLRTTLDQVANTGNSFGENPRKRGHWTRELEFRVKDLRREPAEYLWFVGDYASFDPRNQQVSRTVARLLRAAGVDFGLLFEEERTAGNDVRRIGEEGLFEELVRTNRDAMAAARLFRRILTTDPHSYNTLRNEYPDWGAMPPVVHYSRLLLELLESGRLRVTKPLGYRVTFHDPCHLGRLNGGYEAPRKVLERIGCELVEMPRNRDNSFCCGAGGGQIWMTPDPKREKPSENRLREAASLGGIDVFVTCCPKDLAMFEDARKTGGHERDFVVRDLAELVAEAVELGLLEPKDLPDLLERIVDAAAQRWVERVERRLGDRLPGLVEAARTEGREAPGTEPVPDAGGEGGEARDGEPASRCAPAETGPAPAPEPPFLPMRWEAPRPLAPAPLPDYEVPEKTGPRILVAGKRVAVLGDEFSLAPDGRDVCPEALDHALNEWDDAALEAALQFVERQGAGEVVAVSVGPEDAEAALRRMLAKGAARAVRIWHPTLERADPALVARALAGVAVKERPDLLLTGVQSADFAHAATPGLVAGMLDWPFVQTVVSLEREGDLLLVERELEGGLRERVELRTPAVLAVQTGSYAPRYATMRMIKQARRKPLVVLDAEGVADGSSAYRLRGMRVPERSRAEMLEGSVEEIAARIAAIIRSRREG